MNLRNPIVFVILLLSVGSSVRANIYYVSSTSGNDSYTSAQAKNPATPWRSMGKVNSFWNSLSPGDTVKLQAGSIFDQPLSITKSGIAGKPIVLTTYGSGNAPLLTGFLTLSGWGGGGGNIWQTTCATCGAGVNMVQVGDSSQPMGRWPNSSNANGGYSQIQSVNGTVSITDPNLGASGHNWTGSKVVIRKNRWVIENDPIVSQSGNTITYKTATTFAPGKKFGYFIQGNAYALDRQGEWYYNPANKVVQVYSAGNPSTTMKIQLARIDTLITINGAQYVTINGIAFSGANKTAISMFRSNYITLQNCSINCSGVDAIDLTTSNYCNINNVVISHSNNNAYTAYGNGNTIQNCTIRRTAAFPGMCLPANSGMGVYLVGNNNTVAYNTIDTTGYTAICFQGNSNTIKNNFVNYFCFVKDDGGGIYTWNGNTDSTNLHTTGWITNNIVINGVTAPAGTDSSQAPIAIGIYLDENTTECVVTGNTVAHCTAAVFFQDARHCTIQNNTLFDCIGQLVMRHALSNYTFFGNDVSGNYCVTRLDTQYIVEVSSIGPISRLPSFLNPHNNHYAQLASGSYMYLMAMTDYFGKGSFGAWQKTYHMDGTYSNYLPLSFLPYTINSYIGSNKYTKGNIVTPFLNGALGTRVIASAGVGAIISGQYYVLKYTMTATDNAHTMLNFLEAGAVPYPQLTPVTATATASPSNNNTIIWRATGSYSNGLLVFQSPANIPSMAISNISLYQASVTANNPANNYIFQYNASRSAKTLSFSGTYQDAAGVSYTGSVTIPAYGSVILIRKS